MRKKKDFDARLHLNDLHSIAGWVHWFLASKNCQNLLGGFFMKNPSHTNFVNPTIIEALCSIHFFPSSKQSQEWDGKWYGRLLNLLGDNYDMEPKKVSSIIVQNSGLHDPVVSKENMMRLDQMIYRHKNRRQILQLSPWVLTINEVEKYQSWESFKKHIHYAWEALSKVIEFSEITRIGMRYINRLPRLKSDEKVEEWIELTELIPKRILDQSKDFFYRCETPENDHAKLIITLTEEKCNQPILPIIFDLDAISYKKMSANWDLVASELDHLHQIIRREFDNSQTEKFKNYLNDASKQKTQTKLS